MDCCYCRERTLMCCGVVTLCLTDCVIPPVSFTIMPFTQPQQPTFLLALFLGFFYPSGTGSRTSPSLFSASEEITIEVWNLTYFFIFLFLVSFFDHDLTCDLHSDWLEWEEACNSPHFRGASLRRPLCLTPIQWPPSTHTHTLVLCKINKIIYSDSI